MLLICTGLFAQKITVSGKVTDDKGITIPNASVKIKGSKAGAIADNEGGFILSVAPGTKLLVSASGYFFWSEIWPNSALVRGWDDGETI